MGDLPNILVTIPGAIRTKQKNQLEARGFIIIETNDINSVRFLKTEYAVVGDVISNAALTAIQSSGGDFVKARFGSFIAQALMQQPPEPPTPA